MSETNKYAYSQGVLVPDPRLVASSFSSAYSSITQAGPKAGDPTAQQQTDMVLDATGTQTAQDATGTVGALRILCNEGGGVNDGRFVWRNKADATTAYRGWDPPWAISEHEIVDFTTTANAWLTPHALTLPGGKIVAVVDRLSSGNRVVRVATRTVAGVWSLATVYAATDANPRHPCIVRRADGRLLCYFWGETDTTASEVQVRMYFSDDDGATWALGQHDCLSATISTATYTTGRIRVALLPNGHASMVVGLERALTYDSILYQYASTQSGMSFSLIDSTGWSGATDSTSGAYHDLTTISGEIMLTYLRETGATDYKPFCRFITAVNQRFSAAPDYNGYPSASTAEWCSKSGAGAYQAGDCTVVLDDVGYLYMIGRDVNSSTLECVVHRSVDNGRTWSCPSTSDHADGTGVWYSGEDVAIYPLDFAATMQGGRVVLLHRMSTDAATTDPSLCATYLGGYSTVTLPSRKVDRSISYQTSWQRTWLGSFSLPSDAATWTRVPGGAPTEAFSAYGLQMTGGGGDSLSYTSASATTHTQGYVSLTELKVAGGTGFITMRTSDATPVSYEARVAVTTTSITLRDMVAGADVGTAETTSAGVTGVQILMAMGNADAGLGNTGKVYAWWRATGGIADGDREWELIGSLGTSSTLQAGASAGDQIAFGMLAAGGTDVTFKFHAYSYGAYTGRQLYGGQTNPADLMGRVFASTPTWVDDAVRITARSGPAAYGDVWTIDTRHEYGIENVFSEVSPSPSRGWRSTNEAQQDIVLEWDATLNQNTRTIGAATVAVYLTGCNFQTYEIASYNGAYNTEYAGDTSLGQKDLCFVREGDMVRPSSSVAGTPSNEWYTYHTLAGSHIRLDDNAGEPNVVIRTIEWNSEGAWRQNNSTTLIARLLLSDTVSTDPTGNGTQLADILSKDVCIIMPAFGASTRIRIRIYAQDTAEGYFTIGKIKIGHVAYFGQRHGDGRQIETAPQFETVENRAGVRRSTRLGPARRKVTVAWPNTDASGIGGDAPTPDYHASYTGLEPVAVPADTAWKVLGMIEAQSGPTRPVVYLSRIPRMATYTASQITNRNVMLYSTITSIGSVAQVLGDEWISPGEVLEIRPVTFEEEV